MKSLTASARAARKLAPAERAEAGLNHDGRPWGVPRLHINKHGEPKPALTMPEAIGKALDYDYERQTDPTRRDRGPVLAYECSYCGAWHVGTQPPRLRRPIQCVEIGDRAWHNLQAENDDDRGLEFVIRRFHRQGREAIDPGNNAARERRELQRKLAS